MKFQVFQDTLNLALALAKKGECPVKSYPFSSKKMLELEGIRLLFAPTKTLNTWAVSWQLVVGGKVEAMGINWVEVSFLF